MHKKVSSLFLGVLHKLRPLDIWRSGRQRIAPDTAQQYQAKEKGC